MELSIKSLVLFGAILLPGLSAGLFYAWSVSVIPGTQRVSATTYLETMQEINRAILNPAFFMVFFGSMVLLSIASVYQFHTNPLTFWLMLLASIAYLVGTVGVTALGNVPLNNELDKLDLMQMESEKLNKFRNYYEYLWNRLHWIRTGFSIMAFMLAIASIFVSPRL